MLTKHAIKRMRQRAVSQKALDILLEVGHGEFLGGGAELFYLDRSGRNAAQTLFKEFGISESCLNVYLVCDSDGRIWTVGHRYHAVKHH